MRNVFVRPTRGSKFVHATSATTWGELAKELQQAGVEFEGCKPVIGKLRVTLEIPEAVLPVEDFSLHFYATKIKAGADLPYAEVRKKISEIKALATASQKSGNKDAVKVLEILGNTSRDNAQKLNAKYKMVVKYESKLTVKEAVKKTPAKKEIVKKQAVKSTPSKIKEDNIEKEHETIATSLKANISDRKHGHHII